MGIQSALDFFKQPHLQAVEQERDELGFEPTRQGSISSASQFRYYAMHFELNQTFTGAFRRR